MMIYIMCLASWPACISAQQIFFPLILLTIFLVFEPELRTPSTSMILHFNYTQLFSNCYVLGPMMERWGGEKEENCALPPGRFQ